MGNYVVYKHTSPSGKVYIGITSQKPIKRWGLNGQQYSGSKYFWKAIQKYGWENFIHEILHENLSRDEARSLEMSLIAQFRSNEEAFGYNITIGGGGAAGYKQSQEHIQKRMEKTAEKLRGRHLSEEHKLKIKEKSGYWQGKHRSPETKEKLRVALKGKPSPRKGKPMTPEQKERMRQTMNTPEWKEAHTAGCLGRSKGAYANAVAARKKAVAQYNPITGELIAVYESARMAQEKTGTRFQDISACIHGRQKTAHGYRWELYKEVENECMIPNL